MKHFLLVDDSNATNFFNKTIIKKTECVEEVLIAKNGKEALDYIKSGISPEILFLDINMPIMGGWEFLKEFQKLDSDLKKSIVIVLMIGAKLSEEEMEKAKSFSEIKEFQEKMLTKNIVCNLVTKYYGNSISKVCNELSGLIS
ncbi:response regulator [Aquimarina muelleri]|nr:response regulator [Aquimarina muelleri]MCX2764286.1 response regulator [Aquimarina muelleri]